MTKAVIIDIAVELLTAAWKFVQRATDGWDPADVKDLEERIDKAIKGRLEDEDAIRARHSGHFNGR